MRRLAGIVSVLVMLGVLAMARPAAAVPVELDWRPVTDATHPTRKGAIAYDAARHRAVLFVPAAGGAPAQTWTYNDSTRNWSQQHPATMPLIYTAAAAYDEAHKQIVLVGTDPDEDFCDSSAENETWTWSGSNWTKQNPATTLIGCFGGNAVSYDRVAKRVVALTADFGAIAKATWLWNGVNWTESPTLSTPPYFGVAMATDRAGRVIEFGGNFEWHGSNDIAATSRWSGTEWSTVNAGGGSTNPAARAYAAAAYDPRLDAVIMVGGESFSTNTPHSDTWRWNGEQWTQMGTFHTLPNIFAPNLARTDTDLVLFDGDQTWTLSPKVTNGRGGYLAVNARGAVAAAGDIAAHGDASRFPLVEPIVGIARTPSRSGYWLVARDGGVFSFGNTRFYGSTGAMRLNKPIVGMAATPSGKGYWLVASDGGIFSFGNARFYGSKGAQHLNKPIVAMVPTLSGEGYWLVASDGGIFTFGDARYLGSTGAMRLNKPIVGMATSFGEQGYWLVASDGGIFQFGKAGFYGAAPGGVPAIGMARSDYGNGYWLFRNNGVVQRFGDAFGAGNLTITNAVAAISTT